MALLQRLSGRPVQSAALLPFVAVGQPTGWVVPTVVVKAPSHCFLCGYYMPMRFKRLDTRSRCYDIDQLTFGTVTLSEISLRGYSL